MDPQVQELLARNYDGMGMLYRNAGQLAEALGCYQQARKVFEGPCGTSPPRGPAATWPPAI